MSSAETKDAPAVPAVPEPAHILRVATAQFRPQQGGIEANVARMVLFLREAGEAGAQVVVFPEAAVTGYLPDVIARVSVPPASELVEAERVLREGCAAAGVACVVGTPFVDSNSDDEQGEEQAACCRCYNSATFIDASGNVVGRQHKMQLVPPDVSWATPGTVSNVFEFCGVQCAAIICHDKRYPELTRLPVLCGARVIFYLSCEEWHDDLALLEPRIPAWSEERLRAEVGVYTAQSQARAVENRVFLVKSNVSGCATVESGTAASAGTSHGTSCVIDPTGIVLATCGERTEELVVADLNMGEATALYADKSLLDGYALSSWWREGMARVKVHGRGGSLAKGKVATKLQRYENEKLEISDDF